MPIPMVYIYIYIYINIYIYKLSSILSNLQTNLFRIELSKYGTINRGKELIQVVNHE